MAEIKRTEGIASPHSLHRPGMWCDDCIVERYIQYVYMYINALPPSGSGSGPSAAPVSSMPITAQYKDTYCRLCSVLSLDVSKYHHHHHLIIWHAEDCELCGAWLGLAWLGLAVVYYSTWTVSLFLDTHLEWRIFHFWNAKGRPWGGKIGRCMPGLPNTAWAGLGGAGLGGAWLTGTGWLADKGPCPPPAPSPRPPPSSPPLAPSPSRVLRPYLLTTCQAP